jgi:hypothetical protein
LPRRRNVGSHAFGFVGSLFGEPQAGFDDGQKVSEVVGNPARHLAQGCESVRRTFTLLGCCGRTERHVRYMSAVVALCLGS